MRNMLSTREQPSFVPSDTQPRSTEAVFGIRRNDLNPEVRAYADNLREQVRQIWRDHGVRTIDAFEDAARKKKIPLETVREVQLLLQQLAFVVKEGGIDDAPITRWITDCQELLVHIDDPQTYSRLSAGIAEAEADAHHFADAQKTIRVASDENDRAQAFVYLASAQANAGHTAEAMETVDDIVSLPQKYEALTAIAVAAAAHGDAAAESIFNEAALAIRGYIDESVQEGHVDEDLYFVHALTKLAVKKALAGYDAASLITDAGAWIDRMRAPLDRAKACTVIAAAQRDMGASMQSMRERAEKELDAARFSVDRDAYTRACGSLARVDIAAWHFTEARGLIARIVDSPRVAMGHLKTLVHAERAAKTDCSATLEHARDVVGENEGQDDAIILMQFATIEAAAGHDPHATLTFALERLQIIPEDTDNNRLHRAHAEELYPVILMELGMRTEAKEYANTSIRPQRRLHMLAEIARLELVRGLSPRETMQDAEAFAFAHSNEFFKYPIPPSVLQLATLKAKTGGDPSSIMNALKVLAKDSPASVGRENEYGKIIETEVKIAKAFSNLLPQRATRDTRASPQYGS